MKQVRMAEALRRDATRNRSPVLRTDPEHDDAWRELINLAFDPAAEFTPDVDFVDNEAFYGASAAEVWEATKAWRIAFVADEVALASPDEYPCMVLSNELQPAGFPIRVSVQVLWSIQANITLGNSDMADFVSTADTDGVYRGIGE